MTTDVATRVSELVEPLIQAHGADLYDVVHGGATLQVLVAGQVDLEELAVLTREISDVLDDADPMPDRYTLEVSTPGLERTLRTPKAPHRTAGRPSALGSRRALTGTVSGLVSAGKAWARAHALSLSHDLERSSHDH